MCRRDGELQQKNKNRFGDKHRWTHHNLLKIKSTHFYQTTNCIQPTEKDGMNCTKHTLVEKITHWQDIYKNISWKTTQSIQKD